MARKACFEGQGGLETSIFIKFAISVTLGLHIRQSRYVISSKNEFTWTSRHVYPMQNLMLGPVKIPPSKVNLGILHNFEKTTLKCTKRSDIWEGRTRGRGGNRNKRPETETKGPKQKQKHTKQKQKHPKQKQKHPKQKQKTRFGNGPFSFRLFLRPLPPGKERF